MKLTLIQGFEAHIQPAFSGRASILGYGTRGDLDRVHEQLAERVGADVQKLTYFDDEKTLAFLEAHRCSLDISDADQAELVALKIAESEHIFNHSGFTSEYLRHLFYNAYVAFESGNPDLSLRHTISTALSQVDVVFLDDVPSELSAMAITLDAFLETHVVRSTSHSRS